MFKNMKLGTKISLGFVTLILIAVALGSLAVWKMTGVKTQASILSNEYVPSAKVANEVERNSLSTMYAMRGYAYTDQKNFWDDTQSALTNVKDSLKKAAELADKSQNLESLKKNAAVAIAKVDEYEKLANETKAKTDAIEENRKACDESAKTYMNVCDAFLNGQKAQQLTEFADANMTKDKLVERARKLELCNNVIDLGNAVRIANWRSQAQRDPKIIQDAMTNFDMMTQKLDELKIITKQEANLKQIEECRNAGNMYKTNMSGLLTNWLAREELGKQRLEVANAVLDAAKNTALTGMEDTTNVAKNAVTSLGKASITMIVGLAIGTVIGIVLAIFITRGITKPINRIIAGLTEGASQVASASGQVSAASQSLAEGATEQAAGLEETSSSLEEMSSMTKQNAENAQQAATLATEAKNAAANGNESMVKMTSAINQIQKSSDETAKIIKVIDEIAFQTNLLALNAAVEAARAGEAGKGFAVVAEEVRNLAMRSAEAAKNTSAMIEESVKNSKNGVDITNEVSKVLGEIVGAASKTANLIGEIAASSQEQAKGIDQVNTAVAQMDKVTQSNAANAEESASASEELSAQAGTMNEIVAELVALVGGANAKDAMLRTASKQPQKRASLSVSDHAFHSIATGKSTRKETSLRKTARLSAEKTIPLHDDDLNDFNS